MSSGLHGLEKRKANALQKAKRAEPQSGGGGGGGGSAARRRARRSRSGQALNSPNEFSAPSADPGAFSSPVGDEDLPAAASGFLGKAVGTVHKNLEYWEQTFEADPYVSSILKNGYKIPVKMSATQRITRYREKNEMDFVRSEVARLLKD
jgi:hypothetical protein